MKRTPRSTNRNARPAIAHPGITRRTFIQRTAAASAATAFGLQIAVITAFAEEKVAVLGNLYPTKPGGTVLGNRTYSGATMAAAILAIKTSPDFQPTNPPQVATQKYENYTHTEKAVSPKPESFYQGHGAVTVVEDADGTVHITVHHPSTVLIRTNEVIKR